MKIETKFPPQSRLIPVTHWHLHHQWPPIGGLRYLILNAEKIGFIACVKRVNGRVLIDETAFFNWVEQQNTQRGAK